MRFRMVAIILTLIFILAVPLTAVAAEKWQGTDDIVDQKMQNTTGVAANEPLINIGEGNLGLFIFAVGGFAAGAVFGYQWRKIFGEKAGQ